MAKNISSKEELQTSIDKAKSEIRQGKNHINQLLRQSHRQERKQRTRRLIERGAIAESLIDGADTLTGEQFKALISAALSDPDVQKMLNSFKEKGGETTSGPAPTNKA